MLNITLASVNPRYFNKAFISLTAGICLPVLSGPHPVLQLRYFLPLAIPAHQQPSRTPNRKHVVLVVSLLVWLVIHAHNC